MQDLLGVLVVQAQAFSLLEIVAVVLAVLYLILAIRENIWCWLCAGISTAIFAYLFFDVRLYMESILNLFYFLMAIYGWRKWTSGRRGDSNMPVVVWSLQTHVLAIGSVLLLSGASGYFLHTRTDAAFPYIDSLTSWGAVWATYLVARKVLENWWYWFVIDATMVFVFWAKGLQFTSVLYVLYLLLIPIGLISWSRSWREVQA
ncbi:MAG: nicotinamide riboside transporter PnuC [Woeseiaceae bacterium]